MENRKKRNIRNTNNTKNTKKTHKVKPTWALVYGAILAIVSIYIVLDVFVIKEALVTNATQVNTSMFADEPTKAPTSTPTVMPTEPPKEVTPDANQTPTPSPTPTPLPIFTDGVVDREDYYSDDHLHVEISHYREHDTDIHVAEVYVTSAKYIKTAFAQDTYGRNITEKTSSMAKRNNAVFAVNGDFYGTRDGGYVIRNGILYRPDTHGWRQTLAIMPDGSFLYTDIYHHSAKQLVDLGAWQAFTFGPCLMKDNVIQVAVDYEVPYCFETNPRTAIGIVEPLHYFFVCADARTEKSHGLTLYQLTDFMQRLGCTGAYNLDGGGSSTMYFNGKVVNFPTSYGTYYEREVSDIVYLQ